MGAFHSKLNSLSGKTIFNTPVLYTLEGRTRYRLIPNLTTWKLTFQERLAEGF